MRVLEFRAVMLQRGINPFVPVSAARAATLRPGWRKALPVLVRIDGKPREPWRISMMPAGDGGFYLYLHGQVREASGTKVGDRVRVELRFDERYKGGPQGPVPAWFRAPLSRDAAAKRSWAALPPSRKKEIVRYLSRLRSPEARRRNVARALDVLRGRPGRFMARDWKGGR